ncbi:MAG: hypothetical protein JRJ56_02855 [Deltaproteobacteria bacterium]|jgi:hypothetical protein|nr:hypothetical protein [Deltaproteobacteria bacterium]
MDDEQQKREKAARKLRLLQKLNRIFIGLGVVFLLYVIYAYLVYFYTLYQAK